MASREMILEGLRLTADLLASGTHPVNDVISEAERRLRAQYALDLQLFGPMAEAITLDGQLDIYSDLDYKLGLVLDAIHRLSSGTEPLP